MNRRSRAPSDTVMPPAVREGVRNQLELLSQMIEDIAGELALDPLLGRIVERACKLIGADDGVIGLYVRETDSIRTAASYNIPQEQLRAVLARGHGLTGRVLELDAPLRCRYGDLPHPSRTAALDMDMIGMPIRAHGKLIGVFGIGVWPPREFAPDAQDLLDLFARHAAIAIENAQRYAEEQRRASRFALIARVAAIGATGPDLDTLLQHAADAIHETLEYPNVDIPLIDPERPDTLVIRVRGGDYKKLIRHEDRLPIGTGIMGAAVRERRVQLVNDVARDPRYITPPGVRPPRAELAIPILYGGRVLGVLNVEADRTFDELDRISLEIVAEHLGVAIVNARLFERSTQAALLEERQRLARDLHDNVTQILASMSLITQSLAEAWHRDPAEGERRAVRLSELAQLAFAELRGLLRELSPGASADRASAGAATPHELPDAMRRLLKAMVPAHIRLNLNAEGYRPQLQAHEHAMLRVCQEAASNAVRHAEPKRIGIVLSVDAKALRLRVCDDGRGISDLAEPGMGLANMRERLYELGGELLITTGTPHGTRIDAFLPRADRELN
ncbi:GAF domain-containing protein [Luteimonas gilva]|uniref:GAF domain-containing protein n=1 Tax=Luteimonas gilva TaxID=2572684 RepID=A0A4U5JW77_9GAMM|nr:GAF domain-containing protein [Luteimonas gilva]TKR32978.1 GAF domain-containing protein [Luteimonas gilva]